VIRLIPPLFTLRKVAEWTGCIFFLMWAGSLIQKTYICASNRSWYQLETPQCHLGKDVAIVELITDLFADISLAIIPIRLLQGVGLSPDKRRMLHIMFGASLLISVVSIVHAVFLLGPSGLFEAITAQAEAATALIVANLGVLFPYIYRMMKNGHDFDSKPYTYYRSVQPNGEVLIRKLPRSSSRGVSSLRFQTAVESIESEVELQAPNLNKVAPLPSAAYEQDFEAQSKPVGSSATSWKGSLLF